MATSSAERDPDTLLPSEAFNALGQETRMQILRTLGDADEPMSFTELREEVGLRRGSQFNYHLEKLTGYFINKSDDGYALSPRGSQVYQAILSGAVTEDPTVELTELDEECYHCGTRMWIDYKDQMAFIYCPGCSGNYDVSKDVLVHRLGSDELAAKFAVSSSNSFPPTLVEGRSASEMRQAATGWFHLEMLSWGIDLCPGCSAPLDPSVVVCESHDVMEERCQECGNLQATMLSTVCTKCNYSKEGLFSYHLFSNTAMLDFITDHELNPIAPGSPERFWSHFTPYAEEIISVEPFEARFTFTIDDDAITLTVGEDLSVVDATRHDAPNA